MRTASRAMLLTGLAAVLAAGPGAAPSQAATAKTWTVRPGGAFSASSTGFVYVKDTTTANEVMCYPVSASGTLGTGSGLGADLGEVTAVTFSKCFLADLAFTLAAGHLPWPVHARSYHPASGVTAGTITGMHIGWSGPACTGVLDGTGGTANDGAAGFSYTNGTGMLKFQAAGGNLRAWDVSGCYGVFKNGDRFVLIGSFTVKPRQRITSP